MALMLSKHEVVCQTRHEETFCSVTQTHPDLLANALIDSIQWEHRQTIQRSNVLIQKYSTSVPSFYFSINNTVNSCKSPPNRTHEQLLSEEPCDRQGQLLGRKGYVVTSKTG